MRAWTLIVLLLISFCSSASDISNNSLRYKRFLIQEARLEHGLNAPIALLAGLIHQESRWRSDVKSPVGASGLSQFMPKTAKWMGDIDSRLVKTDTIDPKWSIRAMSVYTRWLKDRVTGYNNCEDWALALSAYNGGIGWIWKDQRIAKSKGLDDSKWFDNVELNSDRSKAAFEENRHYVDVIINKWQEVYYKNNFNYGENVCQ